MRHRKALLLVFTAAAACLLLAPAAPASALEIGSTAPDFQLTTLDGKPISLADATHTHKAVAVIFIATKCPYSNAYNTRMKDLAAAYEKQGVLFVGINSNKTEPEEEARAHARQHEHTFPIAKDPGNKVADLYDAKRTPEVFLVAPDGKVKYHGRIDDNSEDASKVTSPDLKNALDALLAGKPIQNAQTKAFGCTIKRV
ncbi:MAG TPA: thioredoxin family protein [Thermoanaerobaculia bacterium]|jgi:peroxiredoxin|nr:thioredoxin family protein [Thermoanaerobaculia bacterium]HXM80052.1 thioredoxin family protein [Thermoanaerobaculia bacterium]